MYLSGHLGPEISTLIFRCSREFVIIMIVITEFAFNCATDNGVFQLPHNILHFRMLLWHFIESGFPWYKIALIWRQTLFLDLILTFCNHQSLANPLKEFSLKKSKLVLNLFKVHYLNLDLTTILLLLELR